MAVRDVGPSFARIVTTAYEREAITASDASSYLNVPVKYLDKVAIGAARAQRGGGI